MRRVLFVLVLTFCLSGSARSDVAVLTHHNDLNRTGANLNEVVLTANNVRTNTFGLIFSRAVDDQIYAQPLVMTNVNLGTNGQHNLVIVATVNDTVYAFDADNAAVTNAYWQRSFLGSNIVAPKSSDLVGYPCAGGFDNISSNFGILSTPVIDPATGTIYVLARTKESTNSTTNFIQRLHALDSTTGLDRSNSPVVIAATVPGTNIVDSVSGIVTFNPFRENQRTGLALVNGVVYICWASHCDWAPYHGWMMGYDAATLHQTYVYNSTPNGDEGGIWMSGGAPAADTNGNIYISIGNGMVGTASNASATINRGESFVKFTPGGGMLNITSWFTPNNWVFLETNDLDLGAAELLLIPGTNLAFSGGKGGVVYLVNRDNMGGLSSTNADTNVLQSFGVGNKLFGGPVWWDGPTNSYVYLWPSAGSVRQYVFSRATGLFPSTNPFASSGSGAFPGGILSLSANGAKSGTGIVWATHSSTTSALSATVPGVLEAYNAENVATLLWSSAQNSNRDSVGNFAKFIPPTIANGKVYLPTFSYKLNVYGLLSPPQLSVSPTNLDFGTVTVGQTNSMTFQVVNLGGSNLIGTATVTLPFTIVSGGSFYLGSGQTGLVQVVFSPTSVGSVSNNVIFTSTNGGNSTNAVTGSGFTLAQLSVSPAGLNFGAVTVSNTVQAGFTVSNLGGTTITNGSAAVGAPFAIVSGSPFNLAGNGSTNVVISFTPTNATNFSNNVVFASGNGGGSTNAVTGMGLTPAILAVSPGSLNFGAVTVGNTVQLSFTVTNSGGTALTNGSAVVGGPFAIVSGSPFNLNGLGSTNVVISFTPTNATNFSNNVVFASGNGGGSTNAVTGMGLTQAHLSVSPTNLNFGAVTVSNTVQLSFTVTNSGGTALTNGSASVGGPFAIVSGSPFNLNGFGTTNVVINFTPTNATNFSNNVVFASGNGGGSTNAVTGMGLTQAHLSVSPTNLNFGAVTVSNTVQLNFTVTNSGGTALTNGTAVVGAPFAIVSGSPFNLAGFGSTNVVISFTPTNATNFSNNVVFASGNGGGSTNAVTGTGLTTAHLSVSPASLSFGVVTVSNTVQLSFTVTNSGGTALTNGSASVGGPFAIVSGSPFNLNGFGSTNVVINFTPTNATNFSNNVVFASGNGGGSTNAVTGTGAFPPVANFSASPTSGPWPLSVTFTNNSSGTITNAAWDFGDGANTNTLSASVMHNYLAPGTNTVMLTVTGPVGSNTWTLSGYIQVTNPAPVTIHISVSSNQVQLSWPDGTLQSAAQATGVYNDLTNASPYLFAPSNATQFYRVKVR